MVFNVQNLRATMQKLGQKLKPHHDKIHQLGTKVRDTALTKGRKFSNILGEISHVGNKLLPIAENVGTALSYRSEIISWF